MAENPLFGIGFPAPTVTAREIDTLPSRLAQARGVQLAAVQKANAKIDALLEPARQGADNAVGALLEPVEQILTVAGTHAAQAVQTGQLATVKALQQPLVQALKYGYVNQGTPILSPTGRKTKRRKGTVAARAVTDGVSLPPLPPVVSSPPLAPPVAATGKTATSYTIWFNCADRQVVAIPNYSPGGAWDGFRPPAPWAGGFGVTFAVGEILPYLKQYGEGMFKQACPHYIPPG